MQEKSSATERWHGAALELVFALSVKGKPRNLFDFLDLRLTGQSLDASQAVRWASLILTPTPELGVKGFVWSLLS